MKSKSPRLVVYIMMVLLINSCFEKDNALDMPAQEDTLKDIEAAIRNSIEWAKNKDTKLLYNTIAKDSTYIEVHPSDHVVKGFEEFMKMENIWLNPHFKAIGYKIDDLHITLSKSGTVAWFYCKLDDLNDWKGQPMNWENTRWTGVLEIRDNNWKIVQMHFSNVCE